MPTLIPSLIQEWAFSVDLVDDKFASEHPLFNLDGFQATETPAFLRGWETTDTAIGWKSAYSYLLCRLAGNGKSKDSLLDDVHSRAQIFANLACSEEGASFRDLHEILTLGAPSMEIFLCTLILRCSRKVCAEKQNGISVDSLLSSRAYLAKRIGPVIWQSLRRRRENPTVYNEKVLFWPSHVWSSSNIEEDDMERVLSPNWCKPGPTQDMFILPGLEDDEE